MRTLIKKSAFALGAMSFFLIFFICVDPRDYFDFEIIFPVLFKAACGMALVWLAGIVIADIVFKGVINDIQENTIERVDGGFLQRFHEVKREDAINIVDKKAPDAAPQPQERRK